MATTKNLTVEADGVTIFYRSSGPLEGPVLLLLHGFPSSSHQYRNLIPLLSQKYHVIAPDLPGFGFTTVPKSRNYIYTFENFAITISAFLDALKIKEFAMYVFDYGAPVGLRIALKRPHAIKALITQNGNAYEEGFGKDVWAPITQYWNTDPADTAAVAEIRQKIRKALFTPDSVKWQYEYGTPASHVQNIAPESYTLDYHLIKGDESEEIQVDIFGDYKHNVELYPKFQEWFRESRVPILAAWGRNDPHFIPAGAEAYKRDGGENVELHLLDAGHFAVESHTEEIAGLILEFLGRRGFAAALSS